MWHQDDAGRWYSGRPLGVVPTLATAAIVGLDRFVLSRADSSAQPGALDAGLERDLRKYYDDDVAHLEELLGVSLSGWHGTA